MAQESGQSTLSPPRQMSSFSSPSSPELDALFTPTLANSAITTPRVTPDRDSVQPGATGKTSQALPVESPDARLQNSQHEEAQAQPQSFIQPQTQPTRFRPYPPEMYAQGYAPSMYAPPQAYPTMPYTYPNGVASFQPTMVHPGVGMVPGQFSSPPPNVYAAQQYIGPCAPHPYAYPPYISPAPQGMSPAVSYTLPSAQAGLPPAAPMNPPVAIPAGQVQADVSPQANAPQMLAPQGPIPQAFAATTYPAQAEGMVHAFPTGDAAYFYNLGLMHAQPVMQPLAPQQQQYPQMQGVAPTDVYATMGQQMVYPNTGDVQQAAPVVKPSVQSKRRRRLLDDGVTKTRRKNPRPPIESYDDIEEVWDRGILSYRCLLPQCKGIRIKLDSIYNHRKTKIHAGSEYRLPCEKCGESFSRQDGLKRHSESDKCPRNQENNVKKGLTPSGGVPPPVELTSEAAGSGPAQIPPAYAQMTTPAVKGTVQKPAVASTAAQQQTLGPPPLPVFAVEFSMQVKAQAPRPELPQQASSVPALPVFAQEFSLPEVHVTGQASKLDVPQKASGIPPPPVVAADFLFSTPKTAEDDEMDLFGSPEMDFVALPAEAAIQEDTSDAVASIPGFDTSAYDISFEDWMNGADQAVPAVFADSTMDFSGFFGN